MRGPVAAERHPCDPVVAKSARFAQFVCPSCGSSIMSLKSVHTWMRREPGAVDGRDVLVEREKVAGDAGAVHLGTSMDGNPSPRGDGLVLELHCSGCMRDHVAEIASYSDGVYAYWRGVYEHPEAEHDE